MVPKATFVLSESPFFGLNFLCLASNGSLAFTEGLFLPFSFLLVSLSLFPTFVPYQGCFVYILVKMFHLERMM